jgi:hypothetical protein
MSLPFTILPESSVQVMETLEIGQFHSKLKTEEKTAVNGIYVDTQDAPLG